MSYAEDEGAGRPKLSLQPRGSLSDSSPSPAKSSKVRGGGWFCADLWCSCVCAPRVFCVGVPRWHCKMLRLEPNEGGGI